MSTLKIGAWNVNGLNKKLKQESAVYVGPIETIVSISLSC